MCILFIYLNSEPKLGKFRLIVAANRDEYYKRSATDAIHCKQTGIIGGKDMEKGREGGMWLGLHSQPNRNVRFGALLNITGEKFENVEGRGCLVRDFLSGETGAEEYICMLKNSPKRFNGFNFVAAELNNNAGGNICHFGNTPPTVNKFHSRQCKAFGNSPINMPLKKVEAGQAKFERIIKTYQYNNNGNDVLIQELLGLLKDKHSNLPDEELKKRAPLAYQFLSAIYVEIAEAGYGTRAHSIILIDYEWNLTFIEHALQQPIDIEAPKWNVNIIKSNL